MPNITDFYKHLEENPTDWEYRSVFADWLFENNNPLEKVQRWLIKHKKFPNKNVHHKFAWSKYTNDMYSDLPEYLFEKLKMNKENSRMFAGYFYWKFYNSIQEAEDYLTDVFVSEGVTP